MLTYMHILERRTIAKCGFHFAFNLVIWQPSFDFSTVSLLSLHQFRARPLYYNLLPTSNSNHQRHNSTASELPNKMTGSDDNHHARRKNPKSSEKQSIAKVPTTAPDFKYVILHILSTACQTYAAQRPQFACHFRHW